jgi:hypothetical protein
MRKSCPITDNAETEEIELLEFRGGHHTQFATCDRCECPLQGMARLAGVVAPGDQWEVMTFS